MCQKCNGTGMTVEERTVGMYKLTHCGCTPKMTSEELDALIAKCEEIEREIQKNAG